MQTLTINVYDNKAIRLLEHLEALNVIEVIKKSVVKIDTKHLSDKFTDSIKQTKNDSLREKLLNGPVLTRKQIKAIEDTHNSINERRAK